MMKTSEKRVFFRLPLEVPARFRLGEEWRSGRTANLSCGGMLLQTGRLAAKVKDLLDRGEVQVELTLPGVGSPLVTRARAMWTADPRGTEPMTRIGFKFVELGETGQETIHRVLQREGPGN